VFVDAVALKESQNPDEVSPLLLQTITCSGNESSLLECQYNLTSNSFCLSNQSAGVSCGGNVHFSSF